MAVSKVQFDGNTLIDLTGDTVTAAKLHSGYTAHAADGSVITGSYSPPSGSVTLTANGTYDVTNKASAVVAIPAFSVTNLVSSSIESDGTPYNGGLGYKTGYSLSATTGSPSNEVSRSGYSVTGFIPAARYDVIRVLNMGEAMNPTQYPYGIWVFDSSFNLLNAWQASNSQSYNPDNMMSVALNGRSGSTSAAVAYVRVVYNSAKDGELIVTKNQSISPLEV